MALVCIPRPAREDWRFVRSMGDLPDGFMVIGSIEVSADERLEQPAFPSADHSESTELCERCPHRREPSLEPGRRVEAEEP